jgi:tRNA (guanine37-N1)-methyltransferase
MVVIDAIVRHLPGVLGDQASVVEDSFAAGRNGLLDSPHYTRPEVWHGGDVGHESETQAESSVPAVLMSGHHAQIQTWRRKMGFLATLAKRPDLLVGRKLSKEEQAWLQESKINGV